MVVAARLCHGEQRLEKSGNSVSEPKICVVVINSGKMCTYVSLCLCFRIRYLIEPSCFCLNANDPDVACDLLKFL